MVSLKFYVSEIKFFLVRCCEDLTVKTLHIFNIQRVNVLFMICLVFGGFCLLRRKCCTSHQNVAFSSLSILPIFLILFLAVLKRRSLKGIIETKKLYYEEL